MTELLPSLGIVPSINHDLEFKATFSGLTKLMGKRYRARYTGSKTSAVDINGNFHLRAATLRKELQGQKKTGGSKVTAGKKNYNDVNEQNYDNLLTTSPELSTEKPELLTKNYRINKQEVRNRLLAYMNTQRGKREIYFWTVTFPEHTTDDIAYQAFNTWLTSLRKYKMLRDYLWIAERQDGKRNDYQRATNTIHFHIAIPHKMPVKKANAMMGGTLKTLSRQGKIAFTVDQCRKYNGVDIAKDRKTRRVINFALQKKRRALGNYLTKYITKNDGTFTRLAWHNSRGFSCLFTAITFTWQEIRKHSFGYFLNRSKVIEIPLRINGMPVTENVKGEIRAVLIAKYIPWLDGLPPVIERHLFLLNSYIHSQLN